MNQFPVVDNTLYIAGRAVTQLASDIGSTPFFAYDRAIMSRKLRDLKTLLSPAVAVHYAVKANPMPDVIAHFAAVADGLDVASYGELTLALATGVDPHRVSFAGPGKSAKDIEAAIRGNAVLIAESQLEVERAAACARKLGRRPRLALRVNPDFELKMAGMKMSGGPKPFGIDAERVPEVIDTLPHSDVDFIGLHIFAGSQSLRPEAIIDAQTRSWELAARLSEASAQPLRWLNLGGGLGIPYFPGERALELDAIAGNLNNIAEAARKRFPGIELVVELGRFLVGESGIYVCKVIDKKESRGEVFLVTNGGLHHHLSASGNFGQVIRKNYPVAIGNRMSSENTEIVNIVGPLCTPLDILAEGVELPVAAVGDLVIVFQSGAYGYSASPHLFLGHPPPSEICL